MGNTEKKPYLSKRWTDIPVPVAVGHTEFSEEEKNENDRRMEEIMKSYGVIAPNEHVKNGKVIKE